ncbi:MAG: histidine kinase [Ruminococcus sp.]|nr:histidine kinase [Ruminococcus sp.]
MESKKRTPKLLFQITALVIPLFILMTVSVALTVYNSTVNGFLEAKNNHIEQMLSDRYNYFLFIGDNTEPRVQQWFIEQIKKADFDYDRDLTEDELNVYIEYQSREDSFEYNWYEEMPDNIRKLFLRQYFYATQQDISNTLAYSGDIESLFLMELTSDGHAVILFDQNINGNSIKMGTRLEDGFSQHPVWKEIAGSDDNTVRFEKASDFPCSGNYYIGYKPVFVNGDSKAVIGVTYNWDGFRDDLTGTITKALLIIVGGIAAVLTVLLVFLYRKVISPTGRMQKAVLHYTDDKNSARIVDEMYKVSVNNELEYLSDAISDLALEIDHYTKENIRIAGEKERAEKELYQAEVQVMVSQIRPHFMYNALSSIAILCKLDPDTAYEATIAFSKYLRGNMDSLKRTEPVPFEVELEHLKQYLYIEKLRFADKLNIVYDIQATGFELPMLSVQPIAENAVKHGVGMKDDGGTVTISSRETEDSFEVVVADDGVGFDPDAPKKDDGRSHVGMENTRRRLKEMCGADVIITSKPGEGTTARIIIPKKKKEDDAP